MSMYLNNNDVVGDMQFELICLSPYLACLCIDNGFSCSSRILFRLTGMIPLNHWLLLLLGMLLRYPRSNELAFLLLLANLHSPYIFTISFSNYINLHICITGNCKPIAMWKGCGKCF